MFPLLKQFVPHRETNCFLMQNTLFLGVKLFRAAGKAKSVMGISEL